MKALLILVAALPAFGQVSVFESEAARRAASLEASTAAAPRDLLTHCEQTKYRETGRYAESLEFARKLQARSPLVKIVRLGTTPQGRRLVMLAVSSDRAFTPEAAARTGKAVVLIQNGIHAGEIAGKDATAMLLRDVVITKKFAAWLDHVILLAIPVFNVDGHENISPYHRINQNGPREMGFRSTAQRINLNRDYVKADTPEMRAWLAMYTAWLPDFLIDNHVTDGGDYQYDLTISMPTGQDIWPTLAEWSTARFLPALARGMESDGHIMGFYTVPVGRDPSKGLATEFFSPRYSTGYAAIQNRAALLVETHSLKSYRTRVWAHYDVMRHALAEIAGDPDALKTAVREADQAVARARGAKIFVDGKVSEKSESLVYRTVTSRQEKSEISGGTYTVYSLPPVDLRTRYFGHFETTAAPVIPSAYIIPQEWTALIHLLAIHRVRTRRLAAPLTAEFEIYRFTDVHWQEQPFEGRHQVSFTTQPVRERRTLPAGSVVVPMDQRAARVALNILEPEAPDSAIRWGLLDAVFEQKEYFSPFVMEVVARRMLGENPALREEFERKLNSDTRFASSPRERLRWFYERSPYYDRDTNAYPVVRVMGELADLK